MYLWANMSRTLIDGIAAIKPLLEVNVTSVLVYFADGHSLTLPIATRIPKGGFRKPHWVPDGAEAQEQRQRAGRTSQVAGSERKLGPPRA